MKVFLGKELKEADIEICFSLADDHMASKKDDIYTVILTHDSEKVVGKTSLKDMIDNTFEARLHYDGSIDDCDKKTLMKFANKLRKTARYIEKRIEKSEQK